MRRAHRVVRVPKGLGWERAAAGPFDATREELAAERKRREKRVAEQLKQGSERKLAQLDLFREEGR